MSWQQPTRSEIDVVANVRRRTPEIVPLARVLAAATRIEPLLLRNARRHFFPGSASEIEYFLWFSPLVASRSSSEVVFHAGAARLLLHRLWRHERERFDEVVEFVRAQTRHWHPEDRLEQDLRLAALRGDRDELRSGVEDMLKRLYEESDEPARIRLARWGARALATIGAADAGFDAARLLTRFAAVSLGSMTPLPAGCAPERLPGWLAERLPVSLRPARLSVEARYDPATRAQVLHFVAPGEQDDAIDLPTPLPATLHIAADGQQGGWYVVRSGTRVQLAPASRRIALATITDQRYELLVDLPPGEEPSNAARIVLSHLPEDAEQARAVARWLGTRGHLVQLQPEATTAGEGESTSGGSSGQPIHLLRLWTSAARHRLQESRGELPLADTRSALLRVDPAVELPQAGYGAGTVLDVRGWRDGQPSEETGDFLRQLAAWLAGETPQPVDERDPSVGEAERLLAELENPRTPPPRRLAIGDRLAEIGDPRRGVGVREFVVDEESAAEPPLSDEASALLAELENPQTPPPRRLEIGDRLAGIGDPRRGVGLDARGLPEIDWVDVPGGEFVYQQGEKRKLPAFRIARYPLTNAQYQAFVDAGGYREERWWRDLRRPKPEPSRWPQGNRPRTNVDWYEAVAFTRWLSAQLGYEGRLPTEEEWERAAGGREGREYPWSAEYKRGLANIDETARYGFGEKVGEWSLEQTTAVGVYPHGASPEGVLDLSGNVWEWCLNQYDQPERIQPDTSGQSRVLRGGSWHLNAAYARASRRYGYPPGDRNGNVGFRLVSSAPIV
ncbi:SUMF1/EgtB/PvdO family nonheme iron enzyme [Candidatus Accumulibacter cognatus]|uniref:SUMF1/EgtB/PvdO family nonheme iron enzyme n=1 Tax=Candidatus Accumulibacter cognatus TaxID=2954383 RepID=A0A080MKB2_9PROT|nr:SUMF1/EgtB/PvdO family nonheme iron enzyme [Candidatus Accumulibacter cognatus]KFB77789.1 MAG: Serine/threonine-protein kinase pkn1 [Candidatus Accumulibacter cognatus]QLH51870.1 MAG: SUMF1/EgtB/PvdO family nonheme iron enzyme [Candidatus Accumulibacter cognatus]